MKIQMSVSPHDDAPIYKQIVRQIRGAIASGQLLAGDRLASHRDLASQLVVAPLTVKKAYDELERAGLIKSARGRGTFVSDTAPRQNRTERLKSIRPLVRQLVHEAKLVDIGRDVLVKLVEEEARSLDRGGEE